MINSQGYEEWPLDAGYLSLAEYAIRLRRREQTAVGLVEICTQNYARTEDRLNAYKTWDGARARAIAAAVDSLLDHGVDLGPLMGLPVSVKDLYGVPGLPVFAGSDERLPEAWQAAGPIVSQLQRQLGIVVGKTHTVEFAFGGLGVNAHWGTPFNPWSPAEHRVPGGSSSGAGVSLVQGSALLALGTDTAGSVRVPASMTGQVGLKTTHGRWSLDGIVPLSSSLDTPGLLARTVEDLAFAFSALDADCKALPTQGPARLRNGLRIGIAENYFWDDVDPSIAEVVETTIERLSGAGAQVVRFKLPHCEEAYEIFRKGGIAASELAAYLDQHFPHKIARLDPVVRARVDSAGQTSSVEYLRRKTVLKRCGADATQVFSDLDVLLSPTVPITPPRLADVDNVTTYGPANMMAMRNTAISNLFGWCALTMPVGLDAHRMPVGLQLMGPPRAEERLIDIALSIESLIGKGLDVLGTADI
ncbi:amidase [Accumulibacter sp.]|uniref:amidase n=1 Tax=Accumulibacter sp. TaxID=2053492 RepID=UPI002B9828F5|nr:amidase [Accumulibacter sp.]HNH93685.1 amidase [Accumulibacter sp.]